MERMDKIYLSLSVHDVVDFLLRRGDIDNRVYNDETMAKGNLVHASFQKSQGKDYLSEVTLNETFVRPKGTIHLEGRADGIILGGPHPIIDEIKSTVAPLDDFFEVQKDWHFGQAYCYALMYGHQKEEKELGVRLTYISQLDSTKKKVVDETRSIEELEAIVNGYLDRYLGFYSSLSAHKKELKKTSKDMSFPFPNYRAGQREMAKYVYGVAKNGGTFFCEAPTGIGKTISTLFPSLKSFADTDNEKIFYLTAKSTGRESVYETLSLLRKNGLAVKDSYLRAKDKMCPCLGSACNPDECPLTKDYFSKVREIMEEEANKDSRYTIEYVKELAGEKEICPFELQLDLSLLSDVVVCDYNYFFDPFVKLERYFGEDKSKPFPYVMLIDEAHNLIERGRSMYSSSLTLSMAEEALKPLKEFKRNPIKSALRKIKKFLKEETKSLKETSEIRYDSLPKEIKTALSSFLNHREDMEEEKSFHITEGYKNFSREAFRFSSLLEDYGEQAILYFSNDPEPSISLFSLDPSEYLRSSLNEARSKVLFSATLSPISFYMNSIYGGEAPYLLLPCPFPKENMKVYLAPMISTRYKDRESSLEEVAKYLEAFVNAKIGNYFLFFPSFEYLSKIKGMLHFEKAATFEQEKSMNEDERELFLSSFKENPSFSCVGLLVLGGAFSEGIDLVGSRLEGVAIVGVGLSQPSYEKEEIRHYFDKENGEGFAYAYRAPGINRLMQAVGRLIRSETDKGVALLIDDRYLKEDYRSVIGRRYPDYEVVTQPDELKEELVSFYRKAKNED